MTSLVFALDFEAGGFRPRRMLGGGSVEVWVLGATGDRAVAPFTRLLDEKLPDRVVSCGFAGALRDDLRAGDVFFCPDFTRDFPAPDGIGPASMVTRPDVVATRAEKSALRQQTGADLCDMETAHLFEISRSRKIPFLSLRAVSDGLGDDFPVPPGILVSPTNGRVDTVRMAAYLTCHPSRWKGFLGMVGRAFKARSALALALEKLRMANRGDFC